jgi:hypothetical protein
VDTEASTKEHSDHLALEVAELREQLLLGTSDEQMQEHLREFVQAREEMALLFEEQQAQLEALAGQVRRLRAVFFTNF